MTKKYERYFLFTCIKYDKEDSLPFTEKRKLKNLKMGKKVTNPTFKVFGMS